MGFLRFLALAWVVFVCIRAIRSLTGGNSNSASGQAGRVPPNSPFGSQGPFGPHGPFGGQGPFGPFGPFGPPPPGSGYQQQTYKEPPPPQPSRMRQKTPYEVLGLRPGTPLSDVRQAYQELVRQYHPDKVADLGVELRELAERKTKEINAAYNQLKRHLKVES